MIALAGCDQDLPSEPGPVVTAVPQRHLRDCARRVRDHHRTLGLGQDDAAQPGGRADPTRPRAGSCWRGRTLWSLSDRERSRLRNQKVGFVFQFPSLLPSLTALENT